MSSKSPVMSAMWKWEEMIASAIYTWRYEHKYKSLRLFYAHINADILTFGAREEVINKYYGEYVLKRHLFFKIYVMCHSYIGMQGMSNNFCNLEDMTLIEDVPQCYTF